MLKNNDFKVSVDPVIFSIIDSKLHVLLKKRENNPFKDFLSIPGGLMESTDLSMEEAISRVLKNKTGAEVNYMEQLLTRSGHDPRGATVSIAYIALVDNQKVLEGSYWMDVNIAMKENLAFDHNEILEKAVKRLSDKVNYSTLPMYLLKRPFTLPRLQHVYEVLLGESLDKSTFRKKIEEAGLLKETGELVRDGAFRPAKLYDFSNQNVHNFSKNILK
jgi:8-oxo-dGTP diphosphatase